MRRRPPLVTILSFGIRTPPKKNASHFWFNAEVLIFCSFWQPGFVRTFHQSGIIFRSTIRADAPVW